MTKIIFLTVYELDKVGCENFERSFNLADCFIARYEPDEDEKQGPYRPIIYDYKLKKAFAVVNNGEPLDEIWEYLKKLFAE